MTSNRFKITPPLNKCGFLFNQFGCTLLHRAASYGKTKMYTFLIQKESEVDAVDRPGHTSPKIDDLSSM